MELVNKTLTDIVWRDLRHEWLWVYRGRSAPEEVWSPEITVPACVFFVEAGQVSIRAPGMSCEVVAGSAFFSAPGLREHYFARGTRLCSVGIRNIWPDDSPLFGTGLNRLVQETEAAPLFKATRRLCQTVHGGRREISYREACEPAALSVKEMAQRDAAFHQWFAVYVATLELLGIEPNARQGKDKARVDLLVDWLNSLPWEKGAPLLPPGFGIGLRRSDQLLQSHMGVGLKSYLNKKRLHAAKRMLLVDSAPIKEIVFSLGFRHASHFTAWFRRQVGMTPSVFKSNRGIDGA